MEADSVDFKNVALARPRASVETALLPTAVFDEAADYAFSVCGTRPSRQGRKRARLLAARMFLGMKGWSLAVTNRALSDALLAVTAGTEGHPALAAALERRFRGMAEVAPAAAGGETA